jgi:hypothetical protein
MKTINYRLRHFRGWGLLSAIFGGILSAHADPISLPEKSLTPEICFLISCSILLEAACILFLLRRFRKPRMFILWVLGMHLITYPAFLGLLRWLQDMRPAFAAGIGEGLVVLAEGGLIYLICRFMYPANPALTAPSAMRCWLTSFIGNLTSAAAFPILVALCPRVLNH